MGIRPLTATSTLTIKGRPIGLFYDDPTPPGILMYDHDDTSAISLEQTGTLNLNANTNYYVWLSFGTLEDYKLQVFNFTDVRLVKV